ncbi:MAG: ComEC/Rec2 family competence protein [Clostridia bacterium]|nr:ComEC/Rec2 family competence protein [Clostridia bacterium]
MKTKFRKSSYLKAIIFLVIVIVCTVRYIQSERTAALVDGTIEIHIIDVGQGDSVLVKTKSGNLLIDAGTNNSEEVLSEYLESVNVTEFEYCIFTHPHEDHIGGADMIIEEYDVRNVILSPAVSSSNTFERLLDALERSEAEVFEAVPGDKYDIGDLQIFIMGPSVVSSGRDLNNTSVITRLTYGKSRFMFTGDAEKLQEGDILSEYTSLELQCDFLKMGHHGSSTSSSKKFMDSVAPLYAAISCGRDNSYGHPHREIIQMLEERGIEYSRTDLEGSIVYICDGSEIKIKN